MSYLEWFAANPVPAFVLLIFATFNVLVLCATILRVAQAFGRKR